MGWQNHKNFSGVKLAGIYQWVWNIEGDFNWYAGLGGGFGSFKWKANDYKETETFVFAAGDIGIEYDFDIPLLLSLDFRPEFGFGTDHTDKFGYGVAL
ncbi:hypothetical protein MKP05_21645, partial [Halomonas sp. EGI 63088]